jgi:hypothetical protein
MSIIIVVTGITAIVGLVTLAVLTFYLSPRPWRRVDGVWIVVLLAIAGLIAAALVG